MYQKLLVLKITKENAFYTNASVSIEMLLTDLANTTEIKVAALGFWNAKFEEKIYVYVFYSDSNPKNN